MFSLPASSTTTLTPARSLSVVVADDVPEILDLVRLWLEEMGHSVTCAGSGSEVIRLMKTRTFDVIVADVLMPDGDGLDIIVAAQRSHAPSRVLAISGGGKYMTATDCLRIAKGIGADAVLMKPFNRVQFVEAVERLGPCGA
jgi:CheY-like chemotaxis protein